MISLKKKLVEHCINLILISLKNTKIDWKKKSLKEKDDAFYIYCYLFQQDIGN